MRATHSNRWLLAAFALVWMLAFILIPQQAPVEAAPAPAVAAQSLPQDPRCTGYPEQRWYTETHAWWSEPGQDHDWDAFHVHAETCFPHMQTIKGDMQLDITLKLHNTPGDINWMRVAIFQDHVSGFPMCKGNGTACLEFSPALTCPVGECTFGPFRITLPTAKVAYDGIQEIRISPNVVGLPNSARQFPSTGWRVKLANGKPVKNYASNNIIEARGWYDNAEYHNARLDEGTAIFTPKSGIWSPAVSLHPGSGGSPVTEHEVLIDANIHTHNRGVVVKQGTGPFRGRVNIDTTKLSNGWHSLFMRAGSKIAQGHNSGLLIIPFYVQNGATEPGETAAPSPTRTPAPSPTRTAAPAVPTATPRPSASPTPTQTPETC